MYAGRDGSRAFITGDFTESGLTDDVIDLTAQELYSLHEWAQFYRKEYKYKGSCLFLILYVVYCAYVQVNYNKPTVMHKIHKVIFTCFNGHAIIFRGYKVLQVRKHQEVPVTLCIP
jgi:hypothetical protein